MKGAKPKIQEIEVTPHRMKFRQDMEEVDSRTWVKNLGRKKGQDW